MRLFIEQKEKPINWLLKRGNNAVAARVIPYGLTPYGIAIHCLEDGREYLLASNGDWLTF